MKISLARDNLAAAVQLVGRAVSTRATLPSLAGIKFEAGEGSLTLKATDMELSLATAVPEPQVERDGSVLLPGRLLADVVRSLPAGQVVLERRSEQGDVEITAGAARVHLRTLAEEDFPRIPEPEGEPVRLPAAPFAAAVERVARAASSDEIRPILTGVLVQAEGSTLTMVATDSYRLAVKHTPLETPLAEPLEANVPAKALRELVRIVTAGGVDEVEISLTRNQAVFGLGDVLLASRLIDGQFPSWRQLIPESFEHEVRLPAAEFLEISRRVGQLAQRNAPLRLAFAEGELTIAAETPEVGDASEAMPAPYTGEPLEIAFNPKYLIDGAEAAGSEEITLQLSSPLRPGLLRPVGDDEFSYLVMPIRLNV